MSEMNDISAEIDAIIQNTDKKKLSFETRHAVEIIVDKKKSSAVNISGEFRIVTIKTYLDGKSDREVKARYRFEYETGKDFTIEKYDLNKAINRNVLKSIVDSVKGILSIASTSTMEIPIDCQETFQCKQKRILVICETSLNKAIKDKVDEMIFNGEVNSHIDTGVWHGLGGNDATIRKAMQWAMLDLERRVNNGESVVITGTFYNWYEFMPIVVIASMSGMQLSIGRTAGQKLCVGNVLDINQVLEYFTAGSGVLQQFYKDPYSSIEHFKNVDNTINSLIIFPSVLHNFLKR